MKKNLLTFIFTFVLICICTTLNVTGQISCPAGFNGPTNVTVVDASGCEWIISICYRCDITGINPTTILVNKVSPVLPLATGCTGIPPSKDDALLLILDQYWVLKCDDIPDCADNDPYCTQVRNYVLTYPICWQWYNSLSVNNNVWTWKHWIESCPDQGYCQVEWRVCINGSGKVIICPGSVTSYTEYGTCPVPDVTEPTEPAHTLGNLGIHAYGGCWKYIKDCK